jgi:hypothetical protein
MALAVADAERGNRDPELLAGTPGFYLDFELSAGSENAAELLENRRKQIELVAFHQPNATKAAIATVFVPDTASNHFLSKVDQYENENTKKGHPKGETLVASINRVMIAAMRSLYTDDPALYPAEGEAIWWEVWLRSGRTEAFLTVTQRLNLAVQRPHLVFPDRDVYLVHGNAEMIGRLFLN